MTGVASSSTVEEMRWSYVIWQESVAPFLVVELLSEGTEDKDLSQKLRVLGKPPTKWEVYERLLRIPYYVVFDRVTQQLRAFKLDGNRYAQLNLLDERLWLDEVKLSLGVWKGRYKSSEGRWLRWYDAANQWILTAQERAEQETARLQQETARADQEAARAVQAELQLSKERLQLEAEQAKSLRLIEQLRLLEIEPESFA